MPTHLLNVKERNNNSQAFLRFAGFHADNLANRTLRSSYAAVRILTYKLNNRSSLYVSHWQLCIANWLLKKCVSKSEECT